MSDSVASSETILVIGGGISGVTAALELAECGKDVVLIEKNPALGGRVVQLYKYFPKLCRPTCGQEINLRRISTNRNLRVITMAEIKQISGTPGNYMAKINIKPRYVNENCTACGECAKVVNTEIDDPHNYHMGKIKAAYLPHDYAYPKRYVIDKSIVNIEDGAAAKAACQYDAVDLTMREQTIEMRAAAIIITTGWRPYDATKIQPYGYGRFPNVVTSVEFERMLDERGPTSGKLVRPSDGKPVKNIAFIQCAGSRDNNHLKHCSRICCMATLKHCACIAERQVDNLPDESDAKSTPIKSTIYYIDIRTIDRFEDFERKVRADKNVRFVKSKVAEITQDNNQNLIVHGVDTHGYKRYADEYDLVVLAIGMQPSLDIKQIMHGENTDELTINENGFIESNNGYLAADNSNQIGIFAAGCAADTLDVNRAVQTATAAALRAMQVVNRK